MAVETTSTRSLEQVLLDKGQALFTGRIEVVLGPWMGALHLADGQIVDARVGPLQGEAALWRLLLPVAPRITAEPGRARATGGAVLGRPDALLPRARERLALLERLAEKVGGLERVWALRFDALQAQLDDLPDGIHPVLRLLDGKRAVRQVVAECPVDDILALRVLGKLLAQGILVLPDTALPEPATEIIDVEGGLEEALTAALAELSADDLELPAAAAPAPVEGAGPEAAGPAPVVASTSSEPPGPMPPPHGAAAITRPEQPASTPPVPAPAGASALSEGMPQHLALPRPAPPLAGSEDLRVWLGSEAAFFAEPSAPPPAPAAPPMPWVALALLSAVAVLLGVVLGRACF